MEGTQREEEGLQYEIVTKSHSVALVDDTEDIPCPWNECVSLLNIFQFRSHCDQHRKCEHILRHSTTYSHENRSNGDLIIKDKYGASKNRSNKQLQRILSTIPRPSQGSCQENFDRKTKKILDLLGSFRSEITQEHASESGTDSSLSKTKYFCNVCNYKITKKYDLKKHKICVNEWVKQTKIKLKINYNECDFKATGKCQLKLHNMSRHEEVQYKCVANNNNQTRGHGHLTKQKRSSQVKYKRDNCSCQAPQIGNAKLLKLNVRDYREGCKYKNDERSYHTTSSNLERHIQSVHKGIKFNCNKCSSQFTSKRDLKIHILGIHDGVKYNCDQCSSHFTAIRNLKRHIRSAHKCINYSCDKCPKQFTTRSDLKRHIRSAHEGIKYNCDKCFSQFTSISNLKVHILGVHEGVKYICDLCFSQFSTRKALKVHIRGVHEGVKYSCDQCSSQFAFRSNFKRHKLSAH